MPLLAWLLSGCLSGHAKPDIPTIPYNGVGLHQTDPQPTTVQGTIKFKNYVGGDIQIEARSAVECHYGHCPVIGDPSIASVNLSAPCAYTLALPESAKNLMIIATYRGGPGSRIAHTWIDSEEKEISGVDLSLDRPYPPLR